jgi:hypothetical protein
MKRKSKRTTPFGGCVYVVPCHDGLWKIEVNIPYVPSLLTCNRDYYDEAEARRDAFHLEAKMNRMVHEWNNRKGRP